MINPIDEASSISKRVGLTTIASYVVVILLPVLLSVLLLALQTQSTHADLVPHWSDEVYYWQQISAFRAVGFENGYFTVNEQIAPASFSHYYAWGFPIPLLYAALSAITGWSLASMPLYNLAILSVGIAIYLYCVKPKGRMLFSFALVVSTSLAFIMYHFTSMVTVMELGIALGLAGGLYRLLLRPTKQTAIILIVIITGLSLLKVTWALLSLPILLLVLQRKTPLRVFVVTVVAIVYVLVLYIFYSWLCAPYPAPFNVVFSEFQKSFSQGVNAYVNYVGRNFFLLSQGTGVELIQRVELALLSIGLVMASIVTNRQLRRMRASSTKQETILTLQTLTLALYLIVSIMAITIVVYEITEWREFRVTAPILMLVLALLVAIRQYRIIFTVIGFALLTMPFTLQESYAKAAQWVNPNQKEAVATWQESLGQVITYNEAATSPWCNTVYHSLTYFAYPEVLLAFESGVGLSFQILDPDTLALQSRWLLLDDAFVAKYDNNLSVERLVEMPNGALYRNLDANCGG